MQIDIKIEVVKSKVRMSRDEEVKAVRLISDRIQEMIAACETNPDGSIKAPFASDVDRKATDLLDELMEVLGIDSATASRW